VRATKTTLRSWYGGDIHISSSSISVLIVSAKTELHNLIAFAPPVTMVIGQSIGTPLAHSFVSPVTSRVRPRKLADVLLHVSQLD